MNKSLVHRLVARAMNARKEKAVGCVPCFGAVNRKARICRFAPEATPPVKVKN